MSNCILEPGDILHFEVKSAFSLSRLVPRGIRLIIGNKIVHSAMVVEIFDDGSFTYIEAGPGTGIHLNQADTIFHTENNNFKLSKVTRLENNNLRLAYMTVNHVKSKAYHYLDKGYSYKNIFNALINHFIGIINKNHTKDKYKAWLKSNGKSYMCSETVVKLYNDIFNDLTYSHFDRIPEVWEPDDLAETSTKFIEVPFKDQHETSK